MPGRVSTEVDADLSFDTEATLAKARAIIAAYEERGVARERILIKIASTWEGIRAAEVLQHEGIDCNLTLLFCSPRPWPAPRPALPDLALRRPHPRLARQGRAADRTRPRTDPGVLSVRQIYAYYKTHGIKTVVMGASFRNIGEIEALAGCDRLTISPALLDELAKDRGRRWRASSRPDDGAGDRARDAAHRREDASACTQRGRDGDREAGRGHPPVRPRTCALCGRSWLGEWRRGRPREPPAGSGHMST